ncbi:putative rRNA-processing protein EBP2 [Ixodes scapularis]
MIPGFWNIFAFIRTLYGSAALGNLREYFNQSTKIVRLECHQRFNRECLNHNVIPHGLRCRPRVDTPYGRKLAQNFSRDCLKARVLDNKQKLIDCRHRLVTAEKFLRRTLQPDDMHHVFGARKQAEEMERVKCTDTHDKKLSQLIPKVPTPPASAVYNLSSKRLSAGHSSLSATILVFNNLTRQVPMSSYRQAQAAVLSGIPRLHQLGVPTKRPDDYFAQMAKSDDHMTKVREKLLSKKTALERSEKARKLRELKKFGKKVQVEVLQKRQKEKREMMDNLKKFKKGQGSLDFLENTGRKGGPQRGKGGTAPVPGQSRKSLTKSQLKKQYKDKKYGYGGQRKRSKFNTASSSADMGGFSRKKHNTAPGKKNQRPGKARRQNMKNRQRHK